jgi:hypothetical protein
MRAVAVGATALNERLAAVVSRDVDVLTHRRLFAARHWTPMTTRLHFASLAALVALSACGARTTVATKTGPAPTPTTSMARIERGLDQTIALERDSAITAALADVDPARIRATDSALVSFGTRNTFSDTLSATRGIGAARRWIRARFDEYSRACGGCLKTEYYEKVQNVRRVVAGDTVYRTANIVDVLAWLPGRAGAWGAGAAGGGFGGDTTHVIVMTGHYDSCVCGLPGGSFDSTSTARRRSSSWRGCSRDTFRAG